MSLLCQCIRGTEGSRLVIQVGLRSSAALRLSSVKEINGCIESIFFCTNKQGSIVKSHNAKVAGATYTITGIIEAVDSTTLRITELPIRRWTQDYKDFIDSLTFDPKDKDKETFIEVVIIGKHLHLSL